MRLPILLLAALGALGVPLTPPPGGVSRVGFFVTFGQAFPVYGVAPRTADTL